MDEKLKLARSLAQTFHSGQYRRGADREPYFNHVERVAGKFVSIISQQVAYLHDIVEDTEMTFDDLYQKGFSVEVVRAVDAMTKREGESYEQFIERVKRNKIARRVKIYDILDNLNSEPTKKQVKKYTKALLVLMGGKAIAEL